MAYVLGLFAADGCMYHSRNGGHYNGGLYIEWVSTDRELIENITAMMDIKNKIEIKSLWKKEQHLIRKRQFKLRLVNQKAYKLFRKHGFTPAKSLGLQFPNVPSQYLSDFVLGYFDGDGHIYVGQYYSTERRAMRKVIQSGFTSGSKNFLKTLQTRLHQEAGLGKGSLCPNGNNWELSFSQRNTLLLGGFIYGNNSVLHLERKRELFKRAAELKSLSIAAR